MRNEEVAGFLNELADVFEILGVEWKPVALRRAARSVETWSEDVVNVWKRGGISDLQDIPGVGEGIAKKIEEILLTGKLKELDDLRKRLPKGVDEIMHISGVGPKKAMFLVSELKVCCVEDLKKAAVENKIQVLKGFGKKSEADILRGVSLLEKGRERSLLGKALPLGRLIEGRLRSVRGVLNAVAGGSLRRMKETVADIDILVTSSSSKVVMDYFVSMPEVEHVLGKGKTKSTVVLKNGLQVDVRVIEEKSFGAALQYFTGSKEHNVRLRQIAVKKGYKLSEYGLFDVKTSKFVCGRSEEEVYKRLGLPFIPPELRENLGEFDGFPEVIEYGDVKGDLHMHTVWSDGSSSTAEMVSAAENLGYEYIAITDHSPSEHVAHGLDVKSLRKHIVEINKIQKNKNINILKGSEVSIRSDGSLDYSDSVMRELDWVVASVHSGFKSSRVEMTRRVLKAMDNDYVNAIGHPTGRLINSRDPFDIDLDKVFDKARERDIAIEINSFPSRLDLNEVNIRKAVAAGVRLVVNTDAHSVDHLKYVEFGIAQARRGWATSKDVINAQSWKKFEKWLRK